MSRSSFIFGMMFLVAGLVLVWLTPATVTAQQESEKQSAADLFEQTLATEGLDEAVAKLTEALADTTEPYAIDPRELVIDLPARLVPRHQRIEALELVKSLGPLFGEHPVYWLELGKA